MGQILSEVIPLVKLIGLFVAIALIPLALLFLIGGVSLIGMLFALFAQFILAVGAEIVLVHNISRAIDSTV